MSFSWACLILDLHSSSSITSPTYSLTNWPWEENIHYLARSSPSELQPHSRQKHWQSSAVTFLMSWTQRSPQPRDSVLKISTWLYWRLVNAWLRHRSPAGQTCKFRGSKSSCRWQQHIYNPSIKCFWHILWAGRRNFCTCGWHSYSSMRLMHSESIPHGLSSVALQLQRGISDRSAVKIWTFPIGRFT